MRALTNPSTLCVSWEQVPGRGHYDNHKVIIENARKAAKGGRIHAISITDNPGGHPALPAALICAELKNEGIEPLLHLATRDRNRNEIESLLHGLRATGVTNLLILSGDYPPNDCFGGGAKPVFDLDSVQTVQLIQEINRRTIDPSIKEERLSDNETTFSPGVVVSPFKHLESEVMGQYLKLEKKITAGAQFIILQVGYDVRKWHEILQWIRLRDYNVPIMANIYVPTYKVARAMNLNLIPGCVLTDKMMSELNQERNDPDKGRQAGIIRAAKMYAIAKGMGFSGVHIGGYNLSYEMVSFIIERGEELYTSWPTFVAEFDYPQHGGFYLFGKNPETRLNTVIEEPKKKAKPPALSYVLTRWIHSILFNSHSPLFKSLQGLSSWLEKTRWAKDIFERIEYTSKAAFFRCQNCGDCGLPDMAYLCPMANCPKNQRNGPCGGSRDGWCEVFPGEKRCVWVLVYERLKAYGEESKWACYTVPPQNWNLYHTSSWINFYLGRDHNAERQGIRPPKKR